MSRNRPSVLPNLANSVTAWSSGPALDHLAEMWPHGFDEILGVVTDRGFPLRWSDEHKT
jgi:hypothetical protein